MQRIIILFCLVALPGILSGQKTPFTTQDALNVKSFSASDLTKDGKYLAGTIRTRIDRMNIDHKRFGDPGYVAPYTSQPILINTETGKTEKIIDRSAITRGLRFSPDGITLAFLLYNGSEFNLHVYDVSSKRLRQIKIKSDLKIASNSFLEWLPDGKSIILSVRKEGWSEKADSMFREAATGPITVYDSERPFLKWDEIRNYSSLSTIVRVNISSGVLSNVLPEGRYSALTISEKGDYLSYVEYTPQKTVYDRKGGTDYELSKLDLTDPGKKTILKEKSAERINIRWNHDKSVYAFIDSNQIFIRSIYEDSARRISTDTTEIIENDTTAPGSRCRASISSRKAAASLCRRALVASSTSEDAKRASISSASAAV